MKYGDGNFVLKYVSKEDGKLFFDILDEKGKSMVLEGTMEDLEKILNYSNDFTIHMAFSSLQESICNSPVVFVAKRKAPQSMSDLDFNL